MLFINTCDPFHILINRSVRVESIAIHSANYYGGGLLPKTLHSTSVSSILSAAQFYIACAPITVTGGGSGTPGPLVAIPGVYTGYVRLTFLLLRSKVSPCRHRSPVS
jgi:hypothetical protein